MGLHNFVSDLRGGHWIIPGIIIAAATIIALGGDDWRLALRFDRVWLSHGETWRLVSGHLTHLGGSHLALNAAGLLLVWFLVGERFDAAGWWIVIGSSVTAINICFWAFDPELIWYVGLSGLLHGILAAGIVTKLRPPDGETLLLAALLTGKLVWEQLSGPLPGSEASSGGPVVVNAHLYGALGGIAGALLTRVRVISGSSI